MQKRLLIVDDHEVVREGLASALAADERFEIVGTAATGKEALQRARQTLPDIALVDLRLPDMRGEDLTRRDPHPLPLDRGDHPHHLPRRGHGARRRSTPAPPPT